MKKDNQGFIQIIILVILVLVLVGAAYYFGTKNKTNITLNVATSTPVVSIQPSAVPIVNPTTDPTANWKTYTNSQYGFSFGYPDSKYIDENPIKGSPTGCQKLDSSGGCVNPEAYVFSVNKPCANNTRDDLIDIYVYLDPNNPSFLRDMNSPDIETKDGQLGGLPAKKRINGNNGELYFIPGQKNSYVIYGNQYDPTAIQILSTFKFTQ